MTAARTAPRTDVLEIPAANVHAWRIERQLLGRAKAGSPESVARTLLGVQAQVTSSAALAIALRSKATRAARPAVEATAAALRARRLVRSWAMRGTLHLFAADDVPTIAAALGGKDNWRRPAWLRWFGVTERQMDELIDAIGDVLDDGQPRTRAELAEEIGIRFGPKVGRIMLGSWGSALKVASDRHYLCQSAEDEAGVRFVKASRWIGSWREEDPQEALGTIVERYLAAYGPATLKEILRWWGAAQVVVMKPVIARLGAAVTEIQVDGTRAYVRTEDLDAIRASRATKSAVHLIGGFDPLIVGAGLRDQLLPPAHLKRVSRTAGWISPVVLIDGRAAGVWDSRRAGGRLQITVELFGARDGALSRSIEAAAERVAGTQGIVADVAFGRVFREKGSPLVIGPADA
jgi:hypothetical protein